MIEKILNKAIYKKKNNKMVVIKNEGFLILLSYVGKKLKYAARFKLNSLNKI